MSRLQALGRVRADCVWKVRLPGLVVVVVVQVLTDSCVSPSVLALAIPTHAVARDARPGALVSARRACVSASKRVRNAIRRRPRRQESTTDNAPGRRDNASELRYVTMQFEGQSEMTPAFAAVQPPAVPCMLQRSTHAG